jgi:anti-anti-sigma regulatory factor/HAMP domain-containing protein
MHRSIRFRLFATLALNLLFMIALGTFSVVQMARITSDIGVLSEDTFPTLKLIDTLNNSFLKYRAVQLRYIVARSAAQASDAQGELTRLEQQIAAMFQEYQPLLEEEDERTAADQLHEQWDNYATFNQQNLLPLGQAGRTDEALNAFDNAQPAFDNIMLAAGALTDFNQEQADESLQAANTAYNTAGILMLCLTLFSLALSAVLGLWLSRTIVRSVGRLMAGTTAVAGGNLEYDVVIRSGDEFGSLATAFNRMVADLRTQRAAIEQRSEDLQQILDAQRQLFETVRQLSSPVLPVADHVVVLPIVGHVDTRRAQDILDALLKAVAAERARVAILDITGVAMLDTHVMGLLLSAMRAVELLGARAMLAGISAEAAQLVVAQGIELGELRSYRDLRSAVRAALGHGVGESLARLPSR